VPYYDNPAGRLHELLLALSQQNPNGSIVQAWATVLDLTLEDVVLHIGDVADLVRQIQDAVNHVDERYLHAPVNRYRGAWSTPIYPHAQAPSQPLNPVLPQPEALEALELVSAELHKLLPEGVVPDDTELDRLKEQVRTLVVLVREADDLPGEVKQAIVARLLDVEKAIQHVHVGGPDAVRLATEAVYGTLLRTASPETAGGSSVQSILATLAVIFAVFSQGDTIQKNLVAWPNVVHAITTGEVVQDGKGADDSDNKMKPAAKAAKPDKQSPSGEATSSSR